jgi:DNA (cytosine-5)-methyltransferase 1
MSRDNNVTDNGGELRELALFAGAGGGILGGHLLGWRCVCAVEWDAYARDTLIARQNDGCLPAFPIWDDVQTFDGRAWRGAVDIVSGGFPCQDISAAGKGAGIDGGRSGMWQHMARIIGEVRPRFVLVENSPMLVGRGLARVLGDLASLGYDARWGVVSAEDAGAPHVRERIWIVAWSREVHDSNSGGSGSLRLFSQGSDERVDALRIEQKSWSTIKSGCAGTSKMADADSINDALRGNATLVAREVAQRGADGDRSIDHGRSRCEGSARQGSKMDNTDSAQCEGNSSAFRVQSQHADFSGTGWWAVEPDVGRVAHGVAARVDRLRGLGNGQVPAVVQLAWRALTAGHDDPR